MKGRGTRKAKASDPGHGCRPQRADPAKPRGGDGVWNWRKEEHNWRSGPWRVKQRTVECTRGNQRDEAGRAKDKMWAIFHSSIETGAGRGRSETRPERDEAGAGRGRSGTRPEQDYPREADLEKRTPS
uniref:Uncharacterized protein n=1 Tax=Knipowitschia caucasica TaxID=637954 RepID=A0AAV2MQ56_KNICA